MRNIKGWLGEKFATFGMWALLDKTFKTLGSLTFRK